MAYKYTYPVIDPALRNFLVFVLMLLVFVAVTATITGGLKENFILASGSTARYELEFPIN